MKLIHLLIPLLISIGVLCNAQEPFSDVKLQLIKTDKGRSLTLTGKNALDKDIKNMTYGYALFDSENKELSTDRLYETAGNGVLIKKDYTGEICSLAVTDEKVNSGTIWLIEITYSDDSVWKPEKDKKSE